MIRRPPRSTQSRSSAASDVYKRQGINAEYMGNQKNIIFCCKLNMNKSNSLTLLLTITLSIFLCVVSQGSQTGEEPPFVQHLTPENFDDYINANSQQDWFVMMYAPWCGHCQNIKPIWKQLTEDKELAGKVNFAAVNCDKTPEFRARMKVEGYPTLAHFSNGIMRYYDVRGERSLESFKKFALQGFLNVKGESIPADPNKPQTTTSNEARQDGEQQKQPEAFESESDHNSLLDKLKRSPFAGVALIAIIGVCVVCLLYTSPSPRDRQKSRMPSSA
eukprot:TRINITY_DN1062_c0_g1_i2.p1 TRINITY_DN1062_c0_g1~~TRINITY_DN1062_c0_g1_i2.p1  ORF type:complete len:275 (+),score=83.63 TRINITY_DN1062_c0_g1_i2:39-863(+)